MAVPVRKTGLAGIENWNNVKKKLSLEEISIIEQRLQKRISCPIAIKYQEYERFKEEILAEEKKKLSKKGKQNKESAVVTHVGAIPQYCDFSDKPLGEYVLGVFFQGKDLNMSIRCPRCHTSMYTIFPK